MAFRVAQPALPVNASNSRENETCAGNRPEQHDDEKCRNLKEPMRIGDHQDDGHTEDRHPRQI